MLRIFRYDSESCGEDRLGEDDVALVVAGRRPEAQQLGAVLLHAHGRRDVFDLGAVAGLGDVRLRVELAVLVEHPAVRQHRLVGRLPAGGRRDEQRRVEPAAVLVGPFEVEVDLLPLGDQLAVGDGRPRHARLEPDVDDVVLLLPLAPAWPQAQTGAGAAAAPSLAARTRRSSPRARRSRPRAR